MNLSGVWALIFLVVFAGLLVAFALTGRRRPDRRLREIPAFQRLRRALGLAVEAGTRLHVSLGWARLTGRESISALVGLVMLDRIAQAASISDRPPVATSGSGELAILSRDSLQSAYRAAGTEPQYEPTSGRMVGLTPFSYAAGTIPVIYDEQVSASILVGHFGSEAVLITDASEKNGSFTVAGTDSISAQAVLFASADEPLVGEEVFAGGAYLGAGPAHEASLRVEDIFRWVVVALILAGAALSLVGLDTLFGELLTGGLP